MKRMILPTIGLWCVFLTMHGYCFLTLDVWHPSFVPILCFAVAQVLLLAIAMLMSIWRLATGPRRLEALAWGMPALLPVFILYSQISLMFAVMQSFRTEQVEPRLWLVTANPLIEATMDAVARFKMPRRQERDRVVMFYDHRIENPHQAIEEMDAFLKSEEEYFGVKMPAKLHWIRSSVFGQSGYAPLGIAVADPDFESDVPPDPRFKTLKHIDLHEAAHNIGFALMKDASPPMLLIEGLAEFRTTRWERQAGQCLQAREAGSHLSLQQLVSPRYYYSADERVYFQGAALTHVLIEKFGLEKFCDLFSSCHDKTFAEDVHRVYDMTLDELDELFWREIDEYSSFEKATENCTDDEKQLLEEYREAWQRQKAVYREIFGNCTVRMVMKSTVETQPETKEVVFEGDLTLQSRENQYYRMNSRVHSNETVDFPYDLHTIGLLTPDRVYHAGIWDCPADYENGRYSQGYYYSDPKMLRYWLDPFLAEFQPGAVFGSYSLDAILWHPLAKTTVKSVVKENDHRVVIMIQREQESLAELYRLTLDPTQNWVLQRIAVASTHDEKEIKAVETRKYEGENQGVPLIKSCEIATTETKPDETRMITTSMQFEKIERLPAPEHVFTEQSLGVGKVKVDGLPTQPYRRMDRHQRLIVEWFCVSVILVAFARFRRAVQKRLREEQVAFPNDESFNETVVS